MGKRIFNPLVIILLLVVLVTFIIVNMHSHYFSYGKDGHPKYSKDELSPITLKLNQHPRASESSSSSINIKDNPSDIDVYSNINIVKMDLSTGRVKEAESKLRDLLVFHPEDRTVLTMLGGLLYLTNRNEESQYFLNKLIDLFPEDVQARENLGFIYEKNKEYDKAIATAKQAEEIDASLASQVQQFIKQVQEARGKK